MMQIIRSAERAHWWNEWLDSRQSFPATGNFDLAANAHGVLLVHNDDRVDAGEGLDMHTHSDTEILTWVLEGVAAHRDSTGHESLIHPGEIQRMTAGRGIRHSERNPARRDEDRPLRVIQMWIAPDTAGLDPGYEQRDLTTELSSGEPVVVASGMPADADGPGVWLANHRSALVAARPRDDRPIEFPAARFGHLFVAAGTASADGIGVLSEGDAVRLTGHGEVRLRSQENAELLYWAMDASVR
ncbi:pirin family protein [Gordonia hankookensis]|uniref:Pirin family protein n=1 Tax=Gordonia hankookensis TaxID=589403 RepID=A0ABR7WEY9_9ACTN|nr:pirin family protein [Gordonia hankookensis]MBD1321121.1 pirin family protein [Gordonia hankookensis]